MRDLRTAGLQEVIWGHFLPRLSAVARTSCNRLLQLPPAIPIYVVVLVGVDRMRPLRSGAVRCRRSCADRPRLVRRLAAAAPAAAKPSETAAAEFRTTGTIKDIMDSVVDPSADYLWESVATIVTARRRRKSAGPDSRGVEASPPPRDRADRGDESPSADGRRSPSSGENPKTRHRAALKRSKPSSIPIAPASSSSHTVCTTPG